MDPEKKTVKQYRLWLRLPGNFIGELTGNDPAVTKDIAQRMVNGGAQVRATYRRSRRMHACLPSEL